MLQLPMGFEVRGIYFYRDPDNAHNFFYIPGAPMAEVSPNGKPTLSLMVSDQMALLQLGSRWGIDGQQQQAIEQDLQQQFPELTAALIRLSPAPVEIQSTVLQLGDGNGVFEPLQTSTASGFPPFMALFNVSLTNAQKSRAIAALNGNKDYLVVTYHGTLAMDTVVSTTIKGDIRTDLKKLKRTSTLADCLKQVEIAIVEKRLTIERHHPDSVQPELAEKVDRMAKEKATMVLQNHLKKTIPEPDQSTLKVTATVTDRQNLPLETTTDISTWFESGTGLNHVRVIPVVNPPVPAPLTPDPVQSVEVRLGFATEDSAIAFVEIQSGEQKAMLRPPQFDAVKIANLQPSQALTVTTHYTDGGEDWQTQVPLPTTAEWRLMPQQVGLTQVVVDGGDRKQAGSTALQVHVHYQPTGKGTEDERTIYFRFGDWTESWYLVTRSADLGGVLEVTAEETAADDRVIQHPLAIVTQATIKF